jgi:hypothetical protein
MSEFCLVALEPGSEPEGVDVGEVADEVAWWNARLREPASVRRLCQERVRRRMRMARARQGEMSYGTG